MNQAMAAVASPQNGENVKSKDSDFSPPGEDVLGQHVLEHIQVSHHDLAEDASIYGKYVPIP